jgi:hypothetical protein
MVTLDDLKDTGLLDGLFVNTQPLCCPSPPTGPECNPACAIRFRSERFDFRNVNRSDSPHFEEVETYWAVNEAAKYIHALGFENVMSYSIITNPRVTSAKRAYFTPYDNGTGFLGFGFGGIDAAEDADVIWHEYGHAILHNQARPVYQNKEGFGEGFADWWAAVMGLRFGDKASAACIAEWFAADIPAKNRMGPCLRTLDNKNHYPENVTGKQIHFAGLTIAGALWDATQQIDLDTLVTIVLEGNFFLSSMPSQTEAAEKWVQAARRLNYDEEAYILVNIFRQRGLMASHLTRKTS